MSLYKIRHILVGVDMSETSLNALDTAASLARMHGARLSIIWVKDNSFDFLEGDSNTLIGNIDDSSEDILTAMAAGIQHRFDIEPQIIKEEGSVPHRIVYQSLQLQCDLVVMGTHGASGYRACFTGNSTYTVLKYAMCPVLCVPPQKKWSSFKNILFPIRPISGALLRYDVVRQFVQPQTAMMVLGLSYRKMEAGNRVLEEIVREIGDELSADGIQARHAWSSGNSIAEDVLEQAATSRTDMVVVTSALDVSSKQYFIGPNAQKIIGNAKVPVLSIRKVNVAIMA